MIRVLRPDSAKRVDKLLLVVVLPTPPLPPTKIHRRVFCSKTFFRPPYIFMTRSRIITRNQILNRYQINYNQVFRKLQINNSSQVMSERKRNIFDDDCQFVSSNPILSSTFYLTEQQQNPVTLVLTAKVIFYHFPENRQTRKGFNIRFETIFQVLRTKISSQQKKLGVPYGLKFISEGFQSQQFYSQNVKQIQKWEVQLRKFLNQFNFHELFKAQKRLGKGNFATVYLGAQLKDQKKMAIKAFGKQATYSQQNGKQALINEIKITRMFNHPNLMKLQGVYESQNSVYFALEHIEGTPICGRMNNLQKYTENERKFVMKGLLRGLSEMARKNVIHRDLKPQNIILSKEPTIIDFGLATIADQPKYLFVRCGTPGYVAPEIINIKDMSTKSLPISDVFSAGCIFYYLIFNRHLFMAKTGQQCDLVLTGPDFDRLNSKQVDLLRKMLQKEPELRISAAEALRHPYLTDSDDKIFIPKILMKQSGSCPIDLISNQNEAAVKFITSALKSEKKDTFVRSYDRSNIKKKIDQLDINKLLMNAS